MTAAASPLLAVDSLHVSIGERAVIANLSLQVGRGEIVGLAGASGSGKSLTALAIVRLLPARARMSGTVRLHGVAVDAGEAAMRRIRGRDIGMIFQEPMSALNPLLRIGDQVAETALVHGAASRAVANDMARAALEAVGLRGVPAMPDRYPHQLSGGQRQRVAIAIAVVLRPALLIADEPTTALDGVAQAHVLRLLEELVRTRGMGLLLVSHDLAVLAQVADRLLILHGGTVAEQATPQTLGQLRDPYARALLAAADPAPKAAATRASDGAPLLVASGIVRDYPQQRHAWRRGVGSVRAVDDASLVLNSGETVGLVGESGSGKSSLLRVILALERPQAGAVRLLGEDFGTARGARLRRLRRAIQAVFQDPYGSFDPAWPVERLIAEPFHLLDSPPGAAERRRRVAAVLGQVGLSPADATRRPSEFSGGERQRIAIARALVTAPAVIVFDEAVSALDVLVRAQILDVLKDLSNRLELAYLFVSHDLQVVRAIADRLYVMQAGRIVEDGPAAAVLAAPRTEYLRALLAATPRLR